MLQNLLSMSGLGGCNQDCSGRGECHNGTCLCEIRFTGDICDDPNIPYHAGIGGVFFLVALVCAIQLIMCILSEYHRLKTPTLLKACRVTTQKCIYLVICLASLIRGAYFMSPDSFKYNWSTSLLSSYYPLLMSSASLIVCFWAEIFHLKNIRWEKPQFISKSFLGFVTFNIISYGLLLAEIVTTQLFPPPENDPDFYSHLFNGCYAVLLFIVVIFFLIYGVEVYFKVRGGFISEPLHLAGRHENEPLRAYHESHLRPPVNASQLNQSRIGLLSQAFMLIIIVGFLFSETLSEFWKTKVPINSRNWHDVVFRTVEIGVAVWFPAVLWNCMHPGELWILNPQKLLVKVDDQSKDDNFTQGKETSEIDGKFINKRECWICYDNDKPDPLIQPCACTGDVSSVHHDCLRRWLVESSACNQESLRCKVCNYPYEVASTSKLDWERGFTPQHWGCTAVIVTCLCLVVAGAWITIQLYDNSYIRMMSASFALLVVYICIRSLGQNTLSAYQRAKVASISIHNHVSTISENVNADGNNHIQTAL
ncbi:uncharacterized protein LOC123306635 [Coccinella septempunctata]|uniref:uncharacterized protein LOC123306635 n=1 Tax=Coccinella septempunctata TaxID=41139 RepID=UPI001D096F73|nr:uncharacterized protein LOC123306635 [Coccinella septempunctata]